MADEDWTLPKPVGKDYTDPYQRDHDRITVTRGYVMWLMRESARLSANVQVVELQNIELKAEVERLKADNEQLQNRCDFLEGRQS